MNEKIEINTAYLGDCLELMKDITDKSIDLILCDLPYNQTSCDWDQAIIPFDKLWEQYTRIIKDEGAIVLTAAQPFTTKLIASNYKMFKYAWVWKKNKATGFVNARYKPLTIYEDILVFGKGKTTYNPQGLQPYNKIIKPSIKESQTADRIYKQKNTKPYLREFTNYPKNIIEFSCEQGLHPTQKPVALFEYLIKTYTNEGELVLDNTAGSMTTAIAAINTNRNYICMEQDETYFKRGKERIENHILNMQQVSKAA